MILYRNSAGELSELKKLRRWKQERKNAGRGKPIVRNMRCPALFNGDTKLIE
jgi:hypothetical protein